MASYRSGDLLSSPLDETSVSSPGAAHKQKFQYCGVSSFLEYLAQNRFEGASMSMVTDPQRSKKIGDSIAAIRRRRGLTLDGLAELSLVSRAAISALEKGEGNPRVQTLWNLADALNVNFGTLLGDGADEVVIEEDGVSVRLLDRQTCPKMVEVFLMEIPAGKARQAKPHIAGVQEHVVVLAGELKAGPSSSPSLLRSGQSISFAADVPHVYAAGQDRCRTITTIIYPEIAAGAAPDHELVWPTNHAEWAAVSAILSRATIEVQNGLGVSLTTFRLTKGAVSPQCVDELRTRVANLMPSPAVRRFVTTGDSLGVISLYRAPQMQRLGPRPKILESELGVRCWRLAEMALWHSTDDYFAELGRLASGPGTIIEAALAAEVLTRAGRPTVPYGVGPLVTDKDKTNDEATRLFESRIDVDAYESYELVHPAYARQTLGVAAVLPETKGLRIIDVGTGPGLPLAMLRELRPDLHAVAVDSSEAAVRHLARRFAEDGAVEIRQASITDLTPPETPFPCAVSIGASHHLDTAAFLSAIRGQVKKEGRLIVADEMISPFRTREERHAALIRHHLWYILDTLLTVPAEADVGDIRLADRIADVLPRACALAHAGKVASAIHVVRNLYEEAVQIERPAQPSHPLAVFSRFHLLELQALIAGFDYEVEQKTSPARFIALAENCRFELMEHRRIYATDGDSDFDGGTHLFVFEAT